MDFRFNKIDNEFRAEVREFLKATIPQGWRPRGFIFLSEDEWQTARLFDRAVGQRRWLAPSWPEKWGGLDFGPVRQMIMDEEFALAGAPDGGGRGHGPHFVGPAIMHFGSEEQKSKFLPPIIEGASVWAQCFSEDEAGSDMANVNTTAVRDGDDYILNGTKIWTGQGHRAEYAIVTARTSEGPKHAAISLFIVDLRSPGVTINPIWTIPKHGRLNEEVFDNVRVPREHLLGEQDRAWPIMLHVMNRERSSIAGPANAKRILLSYLRSLGSLGQDSHRAWAVDILVMIEVAILLNYRIAWMQTREQEPGHEASIIKIMTADIAQSLGRFAMAAGGHKTLLADESMLVTDTGDLMADYWLQSVSTSIVSGSTEIMRNVIATRGLGLPRG